MRIAIDVSPLKAGHFLQHRVRGTGFYVENLERSLLKYYPKNKYIFFTRGEKLPKDIDLVHYPYFEPFFLTLPFKLYAKTVVTVHDLTPLAFPKYFPAGIKGKLKWIMQKRVLKKVDQIITDSNCSKNDIVKYTDFPEKRINVIYLAPAEEFKKIKISENMISELIKKYHLPDKFILYVGDVTWNKNLPRLVEAIKKTNLKLVLVGKTLIDEKFDKTNPWNKDLNNVIEIIRGDEQFIRTGFVPTNDLVSIYNLATVFVMPSLYEGFGLPILEAMACGCPVVTTKEGSIPEVAGDAVYYVDAYDLDSIISGIEKIFYDQKAKNELSAKGLDRVKNFSWKKVTDETVGIYEKNNK